MSLGEPVRSISSVPRVVGHFTLAYSLRPPGNLCAQGVSPQEIAFERAETEPDCEMGKTPHSDRDVSALSTKLTHDTLN